MRDERCPHGLSGGFECSVCDNDPPPFRVEMKTLNCETCGIPQEVMLGTSKVWCSNCSPPAEPIGKMTEYHPKFPAYPKCEHHWSADFKFVDGQKVYRCVLCQEPLPESTAPPEPSSVEDARALNDAVDAVWNDWNKMYHPGETQVPALERAAIVEGYKAGYRDAQAEIQRQTPAIIERFVEEVEEIVESRDFCPECLGRCTYPHAIQTVKARRSGGEGK